MAKIDLTAKEAASLKLHFQKEHLRLTAALDHVETMLAKLGAPAKTSTEPTKKGTTLTAKGVPAKKRGPKSIWGAFIQKRLRARNRPMSYDELIADAMSIHKIPEARLKSAKASILNSAFDCAPSTENHDGGRAGKKDKMVVLTKWLEADGQLKPEYGKAFKAAMGGKAQRVDMASIPVSAYEED